MQHSQYKGGQDKPTRCNLENIFYFLYKKKWYTVGFPEGEIFSISFGQCGATLIENLYYFDVGIPIANIIDGHPYQTFDYFLVSWKNLTLPGLEALVQVADDRAEHYYAQNAAEDYHIYTR
jgi:hypothetical protein